MTRRQYAGAAKQTTITGSVASSGAVSIAIADSTGWPDASVGPFAAVIDPGTASEEKVQVTARVGLTLTVTAPNRGFDGTSAIGHASGATIYHTYTAIDFDEANAHINAASGSHTAAQITNVPAGTISATNVQNALNELDTDKATTGHTQASSTISDFTEAVQDVVGAFFVDGVGIDSVYSDGSNTLTVTVDPSEFTAGSVPYAALASATQVLLTRSSTSVTHATITDVVWDAETDPDNMHSGGTITIPSGKAGFYVMQLAANFVSGTTGIQLLALVDGVIYSLTPSYDRTGNTSVGSMTLPLNVASTVKFQVYHTSGSSKTYAANGHVVRIA